MRPEVARIRVSDPALAPIRDKVLSGERLSFADGVALYRTADLLGLGSLANHVRERLHGDVAYLVWNTHINHTNVCVATCDFCAFAAKKDEPRAYTMSLDTIFANVAALPAAVRVMAEVQLGRQLSEAEVGDIVAFLGALTGPMPAHYAPP